MNYLVILTRALAAFLIALVSLVISFVLGFFAVSGEGTDFASPIGLHNESRSAVDFDFRKWFLDSFSDGRATGMQVYYNTGGETSSPFIECNVEKIDKERLDLYLSVYTQAPDGNPYTTTEEMIKLLDNNLEQEAAKEYEQPDSGSEPIRFLLWLEKPSYVVDSRTGEKDDTIRMAWDDHRYYQNIIACSDETKCLTFDWAYEADKTLFS